MHTSPKGYYHIDLVLPLQTDIFTTNDVQTITLRLVHSVEVGETEIEYRNNHRSSFLTIIENNKRC